MNPKTTIVLALYVGGLVIANAIASQLIGFHLGSTVVVCTAGALAYPLSFVLQDVISELEGERVARAAVYGSLGAAALLVVYSQLAIAIGSHDAVTEVGGVDPLPCFEATFRQTPRVVLASLTAFLVGGLVDVRVFFAIRRVTGQPHLWLRKVGSTVVGQLVDSSIFATVAFAGSIPLRVVFPMALLQWALKVAIAIAALPGSYAVIAWMRR